MSRIHPSERANRRHDLTTSQEDDHVGCGRPSVLTVWKRSSMSFQGTDGFTIYDHHGKLVFRVDNYSRNNASSTSGGLLVLMDGPGNSLLTLKPQLILSMHYQWNAYGGEYGCRKSSTASKVFSMRSPSVLFHRSKDEAEIFVGATAKQSQTPDFRVEGDQMNSDRGHYIIRSFSGGLVTKMTRKRVNTTILLGDDVFTLVVQPAFETGFSMAFVVILDHICSKPYASIGCS
ncbi:LOW QUALITY PROTEIN: Tub_2 domain-containing protein, partial [Cephalotus follicularis]